MKTNRRKLRWYLAAAFAILLLPALFLVGQMQMQGHLAFFSAFAKSMNRNENSCNSARFTQAYVLKKTEPGLLKTTVELELKTALFDDGNCLNAAFQAVRATNMDATLSFVDDKGRIVATFHSWKAK